MARHTRVIDFGPWTISEYWPGGVFSGYGANCYRHRNSWQAGACKRVFTFSRNTVDETICIAKRLLIMGAGIRSTLRNGKFKHIDEIPRRDIPVLPEAELDARAATFV